MRKRLLCFIFVAVELSVSLASIRFEEVEFEDPSVQLDRSNSIGFECAHLGEECQITVQCCGVATCALPSWSKTPVCLVPGYKHDKRFKKISAVYNLRPEDIRYIRDSYNTSQYDFLLSDLTFSAPPLETAANLSSDSVSANATGNGDEGELIGYLRRNVSAEDYGDNSTEPFKENVLSLEREGENVAKYNVNESSKDVGLEDNSNSVQKIYRQDVLDAISQIPSQYNLTESPRETNFYLNNHFNFLLINNTVGVSDPTLDLTEVYNQFVNSDSFKTIVEHLKEKMRKINEIETKLGINHTIKDNNLTVSKKIRFTTTTEKLQTTTKASKWAVVRRLFLHKNETPQNNKTFMNNLTLTDMLNKIVLKQPITSKDHVNAYKNVFVYQNFSENPDDIDGLNRLIEDVNKINDLMENDKNIPRSQKSEDNNDGDVLDVYNIDIPLNSAEKINGKPLKVNNSLEDVIREIGKTINSIIARSEEEKSSLNNYLQLNKEMVINNLSTKSPTSTARTTVKNGPRLLKRTHFWEKIRSWEIRRNISAELKKDFKNWFIWKKQSKMTSKQKQKIIPLNEYFLMNFNSKNLTEETTVAPLKILQTEKVPEYSSYFSSSESSSSGSQELYNDSYVFMVHQIETDGHQKISNWKKVLSFFHKDEVDPIPDDNNHQNSSTTANERSNKATLKTNPNSSPETLVVPEVIRLPESLMPYALERRQPNDTDWIFQDSEALEDETIEVQRSNSSFFFFFK